MIQGPHAALDIDSSRCCSCQCPSRSIADSSVICSSKTKQSSSMGRDSPGSAGLAIVRALNDRVQSHHRLSLRMLRLSLGKVSLSKLKRDL